MDSELIFKAATAAMFFPWAMMIFAPRHRWTERIVVFFVLIFCAGAVFVIVQNTIEGRQDGDFLSLNGLTRFFQNRGMMLAGWLNYLAFSLSAGIWQQNDSENIKLSHIWVVPSLILTFLAGPLGLILYLFIRGLKTGTWQMR
jgi:hypothetical protein